MTVSRRMALMGLAATVAGCTSPPRLARSPSSSASAIPGAPDDQGQLVPQPRRRPPAVPAYVDDPALIGLDAVIDISHFNRVSNLALARSSSNILGVIHKATEGYDWVDPLYAQRRAACEAAGMLWGAYHFGTFERPGAEQARSFLAAAQPSSDTLLALDLELNDRNQSNSMDIVRAEDFVRTVLMATGRLPILYIHPAWADGEAMGGRGRTLGGAIRPGSMLAACDLWLADYRAQPELPSAWVGRGWRLWQYAGDGTSGGPFKPRTRQVAGIEKCDRNLFAADQATLIRYWKRGNRTG
ncbi:glycoside hydrolase family 25 protein [Magnetospirillum fulvum]|uniref:Lyzozyme M1 n=1 Tax=Magnetospirillum fulvum MGU-K5 TaxID=1316936 RepID=S9TSI8_MAGFU|nr:glycoside hydrolase family 25 protein [Magnetospirillum fulvum]EPY01500.1 Lyzozyme M1 [Magnetospirillum fulvum MGU-K5]